MIMDASVRYRLNNKVTFTANTINLANKAYLTSRHPSGVRAGHPFGLYGGVRITL